MIKGCWGLNLTGVNTWGHPKPHTMIRAQLMAVWGRGFAVPYLNTDLRKTKSEASKAQQPHSSATWFP